MSVKNKLNIALELLKEASILVTDESKTQIDLELDKLKNYLEQSDFTEFNGSEEMAFSILLECIQVCVAKMGAEYFNKPSLPNLSDIADGKIKSTIPFAINVRKDEVIDMLHNMMGEEFSSDVVRSLNINTFMTIFNLKLLPDESSSSSEGVK